MTLIARSARNIPGLAQSFQSPPRGVIAISGEKWLDIRYCALLLVLTAIMVLPGGLSLPMELWDESRTANNAIEMARHGGWMVPTFGGEPDHWNTKPPLLIWIMAALSSTGMDPMLAVRLPSIAATMGSVLLVYVICRNVIQDRLVGVLAGLLVLCSVLFMGDHVGRTGDYDALLSLLCTGFVICVGRYVDAQGERSGGERAGCWIGAGGVLLFLAIMTKGVAAGLAVPGLLVYVIMRRRFLAIARDWRLWVSAVGVIAGVAGWLALREQLDPGYLVAAWHNDVSGRLLIALDDHSGGPFSYLMVRVFGFQPAMLLLPMLLLMGRDQDPTRRRLCLLMTLAAASCIVALSCASTKIYWYVAPVVPLLAIAVATATVSFLRRGKQPQSLGVVFRPVIFALLITFWYLNFRAPDEGSAYTADQVWYGAFLDKIRDEPRLDGALIIDLGLPNDAGFRYYNPVARFFAEIATWRGTHVTVVPPDAPIAKDATILSCDPRVRHWLDAQSFFTVIQSDTRCVLGQVSMPADQIMAPGT